MERRADMDDSLHTLDAPLDDVRIVHIAGHGFHAGDRRGGGAAAQRSHRLTFGQQLGDYMLPGFSVR
jgi:hypothetical protein